MADIDSFFQLIKDKAHMDQLPDEIMKAIQG